MPQIFYQKDKRVNAVMIEVRRDLYMNEETGKEKNGFTEIARLLRQLLANAHA